MMLGSGSVLGMSATGCLGLPADQTAHAAPADLAATSITLPRGTIWAAQVGDVRPHTQTLRGLRDRVTDEVPREAPRAGGLLDIRA